MKLGFKTLLLSGAVCMLFAANAKAEGWYVGADAGVTVPFDSKAKFKTSGTKEKVKFDNGFVGDLVLGYKFDNNFRSDLDFGYRNIDFNKFAGEKNSSELNSYAFTLNVYYDFINSSKFTPFVGLGAGLAINDVDGKGILVNKKSTGVAFQGTAGVAYNIADNWDLSLAYRYFKTFDHKLKQAESGRYGKYNFSTQDIILGIRYTFECPKAKKYSAPAPVASIDDDMIFFALNSYEISPEAMKVLKRVAEDYKTKGQAHLKLTGHTDLTGTKAYNLNLSKQRAAATKDVLVKLGIPAAEIATFGVGEANPLVPTAAGVPELQNRRVVLDIVE